MSIHINAKEGKIAKTVIMPGDPLRAKLSAENFLEDYEEVTNIRGMLGFTRKIQRERNNYNGIRNGNT